MGFGIGQRFLELAALRDRPGRRETGVVGMLQFLSGGAWMALFGKTADALEKSTDTANACAWGGLGEGAAVVVVMGASVRLPLSPRSHVSRPLPSLPAARARHAQT